MKHLLLLLAIAASSWAQVYCIPACSSSSGGANPAGSGSEVQYRIDGTTFGGITNMAGGTNPLFTAITAPSTPASGKGVLYIDSTSKNIAVKDDAGVVKHGVQTKAAVTHNFATAVSDAGVVAVAQPAAADLSDGVSGTGAVCLASGSACTPVTVTAQSANLGNFTGGTAARVLGTVYQNTNSGPLFINVVCQSTGASQTIALVAKTDSAVTPTTSVAFGSALGGGAGQPTQITFFVLAGNYYSVASAGGNACGGAGANGTLWIEWH